MPKNTESTVNEVVSILEGVIKIAPDLLSIFNTLQTKGVVTTEDLEKLADKRRAAIAEAQGKLAGGA